MRNNNKELKVDSIFYYFIVQPGNESLLKQELHKKLPKLNLAFSGRGFLTFKQSDTAKELMSTVTISSALSWGMTIKLAGKDHRNGYSWKLEEDHWQVDLNQPISAAKTPILDFIEFGGKMWVGSRVKRLNHFFHLSPRQLPEHAPSRAYLKIEEAIHRFSLPFLKGQKAIEIGCAPGGISYALLQRQLLVWGVDTAQVDSIVLENKNFTHLKKSMQQLQFKDIPKNPDWLLMDVNLPADQCFEQVYEIIQSVKFSQGVFLTLKMTRLTQINKIDKYKRLLQDQGFKKVETLSLLANKKEITLLAWQR